METTTVKLPPKLILAEMARGAALGDYDAKREKLTATMDQLQDLRQRAVGLKEGDMGMKIAATFLLKALDKIPGLAPSVGELLVRETGPMPSFMIVGHGRTRATFDPDPRVQGYKDACRGITANPYGLREPRRLWDAGHDQAYDEGRADKPRFGRATRNGR